ncbi:hypothetical protein BYT27DRAFT_7249982 [Phlegmacium glaucopus]|nr:hypothetical protein BYT27DRAFT_7249982 [Phlegmacium glaucopus]
MAYSTDLLGSRGKVAKLPTKVADIRKALSDAIDLYEDGKWLLESDKEEDSDDSEEEDESGWEDDN